MNAHVLAQTKPAAKGVIPKVRSNFLQRKCACGGMAGPTGECEECRNKPQSNHSGSSEIPAIVNEVLNSPGQPLNAETRAFMEPRFRHDFSHVRVHTDAKAAESTRAVNAHAYTVGQNVVFGANEFAPAMQQGRELLAHELAHTIQQGGASSVLQLVPPDSMLEAKAEQVGRDVTSGRVVTEPLGSSELSVARQPAAADEEEGEEEEISVPMALPTGKAGRVAPSAPRGASGSAPGRATTLSLIHQDPRQITDEEIYKSIREPKPEEPDYWARQQAEWLEKPIQIGSQTKYVRKWKTVTIEGVGDQGDRHVDVEESHWSMTGPALRGYFQYMVGELTPFEESIVQGKFTFPEGFTPVAAGNEIGYYTESGGSGARHHTIYKRDGTIFSDTTSETPLVSEGIGPLALALPGIGVRSLGRDALSLGKRALNFGKVAGSKLAKGTRSVALAARLRIAPALEAGMRGAEPFVTRIAAGGATELAQTSSLVLRTEAAAGSIATDVAASQPTVRTAMPTPSASTVVADAPTQLSTPTIPRSTGEGATTPAVEFRTPKTLDYGKPEASGSPRGTTTRPMKKLPGGARRGGMGGSAGDPVAYPQSRAPVEARRQGTLDLGKPEYSVDPTTPGPDPWAAPPEPIKPATPRAPRGHHQAAGQAARDARAQGLEDLQKGRVGMQEHRSAREVRKATSQVGQGVDSTHIVGQAIDRAIGTDPNIALTVNLPKAINNAIDNAPKTGWVPKWNQAQKLGKRVTGADYRNWVQEGIRNVPENLLSKPAKGTLEWVLDVELRGLGITADTVLLPGVL